MIKISPKSGLISVEIHLSVVVFPAPFGPKRPYISPFKAVKLNPLTATFLFESVLSIFCCFLLSLKVFDILLTTTIFSIDTPQILLNILTYYSIYKQIKLEKKV